MIMNINKMAHDGIFFSETLKNYERKQQRKAEHAKSTERTNSRSMYKN